MNYFPVAKPGKTCENSEPMSLNLNPKQQEAVLADDGPVLVLAGAGSGKTRVLTQRIIHLIRDKKVSPWSILAVTFTNKAASEMKARIVKDLGPNFNNVWVSTFHSSCLRILRRFGEKLGYESQFAIYDSSDQLMLVKKVLSDLELNDKIFQPKAIQKQIDRAKNEGLVPSEFPTEGDHYLTKVQEVYTAYQKELKANQAMDFGDLILNVIRLFETHPEVLAHYHQQFRYMLVDEYQDTNTVQYRLIKLLTALSKNPFVVGDDDQSIYRFRGAEIRNILNFQNDYPDAKVIRLEQNYRSTQMVLNAANAVIRNNENRMGKELWTENKAGEAVHVYRAQDEKQEAEFIVDEIQSERQNFSLNEMAIFYRTNAQSRALEDALRKARMAYKIYGGMKFYDRAEIKDVMAYLRVLVNPYDSVSLKRIINVPGRGLGKTTLQKIQAAADQNGVSFWNVLENPIHKRWGMKLNAGTVKKLRDFYVLMTELMQAKADLDLIELVPQILESTHYWQMLTNEGTFEADARKENLSEFINVIEEYVEDNAEGSLEEFLDQISLASDVDGLDENQEFVTLMTIHLAKGLEFPIVFLAGMEEGLFPHARSLDQVSDLEEERRICYVGMTRAMQKLTLSYADVRRIFGTSQYNVPSRFLQEIPEDYIRFTQGKTEFAFSSPTPNRFRSPSSPPVMQRRPASNETYIDVSESQMDVPFPKGSLVQHEVFGKGQVQNYEGHGNAAKVTVNFQNGAIKKLNLKYAHLTLLTH